MQKTIANKTDALIWEQPPHYTDWISVTASLMSSASSTLQNMTSAMLKGSLPRSEIDSLPNTLEGSLAFELETYCHRLDMNEEEIEQTYGVSLGKQIHPHNPIYMLDSRTFPHALTFDNARDILQKKVPLAFFHYEGLKSLTAALWSPEKNRYASDLCVRFHYDCDYTDTRTKDGKFLWSIKYFDCPTLISNTQAAFSEALQQRKSSFVTPISNYLQNIELENIR